MRVRWGRAARTRWRWTRWRRRSGASSPGYSPPPSAPNTTPGESLKQGCESAFISSGSGSSIFGWIPIRIRIQYGSRALITKNLKKITAKKLNFFGIKNYNLPIPRPPQRTFKLQKKPSALKRGHPTLQNMNFLKFFLLLWVIFALLYPDPDPLTRLNPDPIRIRIRILNPGLKGTTVHRWDKYRK